MQSAQASLTSPEEAAATAASKYDALGKSIGSTAQIVETLDLLKADEELSSGVAQYEAAMQAIDAAMAQRPMKLDANGMPIDDADDTVNVEREAREKIVKDVRGTMKTGRALRQFDKYTTESGTRRGGEILAKSVERSIAILGAKGQKDIETLTDAGMYDEAGQRNNDLYSRLIIGPAQFVKNSTEIGMSRDSKFIYDSLLNPTTKGLYEALTAVQTGVMPDGTLMVSPVPVRDAYAQTIRSRLEGFDAKAGKEHKTYQDNNLIALILPSLRKEVSSDQIVQFGLGGDLSATGVKFLVNSAMAPRESEPKLKGRFMTEVLSLGVLPVDDFQARSEELQVSILSQTDLSDQDKITMIERLQNDSKIIGSQEYQIVKTMAYRSITGFAPDSLQEMTAKMSSHYSETAKIGSEFMYEVLVEARRLGYPRRDELQDFFNTREKGFRLKANEKVLSKVETQIAWPKDGEVSQEMLQDITRQMNDYINNAPNADATTYRISDVTDAITEIEKLTGIVIDNPIKVP